MASYISQVNIPSGGGSSSSYIKDSGERRIVGTSSYTPGESYSVGQYVTEPDSISKVLSGENL